MRPLCPHAIISEIGINCLQSAASVSYFLVESKGGYLLEALQTVPETNQEQHLPEVNRAQIIKYLDAFGLASELTEQEKLQFIEIAEAYQLNPFKREIYAVPYGQGDYRRLSIITGYEVFLKRAERTGKLDGWHTWVEGETEENFKAVIEIRRKDWQTPFRHEVFYKEAVQRKGDGTVTSFWRKMPRFQLRKVCISQGFRLAFPDELGGIPYDPSELPEEMGPRVVEPDSSQDIIVPETPALEQTSKAGAPESPEVGQLSRHLVANKACFTDNHREWILKQLENNPSPENIQKMTTHIEEVIKNKSIVKPLKRMGNAAKQKEAAAAQKESHHPRQNQI
jgi:phage recombination protein Bet